MAKRRKCKPEPPSKLLADQVAYLDDDGLDVRAIINGRVAITKLG